MFYLFINFTTLEEYRMPVEAYSSPTSAKTHLYNKGYASKSDQVDFIGLVD
jgi:hypothetical protein